MASIPLITIIGVPNTGKSTLFNRLIGMRKALVHSSPGMTRDIYRKKLNIAGKIFHLQDSGGFFPDDHIITEEINKRIFREARASDLVIFLFDGKRDLLGYEKDLFLEIRKINSRIIPVINKVDNPERYILPTSYYALKQDFLMVSAEHNLEVETLIEAMEKEFGPHGHGAGEEEDDPPRISIMGKPNVGKSSIINKILDDEAAIVSPLPGTTRDSVDLEIRREKKTFILVDNAGIRKLQKVGESTESAAVIRAEKDIRFADIIIFVLDISRKIDQTDMLIARKLLKSAKPVIVACNKWDLVMDKEQAERRLQAVRRKLNFFYFAPFLLVSAKTGKNVFKLIDRAEAVHRRSADKIKASQLNETVRQILDEKKLLTESNRAFRPLYMAVESARPFFIRFYFGSGEKLKASHETYLKKRILEMLDMEGVPLFFNIAAKKKK